MLFGIELGCSVQLGERSAQQPFRRKGTHKKTQAANEWKITYVQTTISRENIGFAINARW